MNESRFKKIYADNRLRRFKTKNVKNLLTKQIKIYKILNITPENSIDAMKKSNNVNRNARIDNEVRSEIAQNIAESSNASSQIFENDTTDDNLSNSKIQDIHARIKFSIRRFNRLIEIENSLNGVERNINTATFAAIDKILIEKK